MCEEFKYTDLGEIQEPADTTPEELTKDLMERSASEPVPDHEEEHGEKVPGNRSTFDSLAEGFRLFKTAFHLFIPWTLL